MSYSIQLYNIQNSYAFNETEKDSIFLGKTLLPKQVLHLNGVENYMVGNRIICASGMGNGQWDFIAGIKYNFKMEYYENGYGASAHLR